MLAQLYFILAIREHIAWCIAGFLSHALYPHIFWQSRLVSQAILQIFSIVLAAFGFWRWWRDGGSHQKHKPIVTWPIRRHLARIILTLILSLAWGRFLATHGQATYPYLDAMTTDFAIVTTWLVAEKVLEKWNYWFVIDTVSIWLYVQRDLWLTAALFTLYMLMCIIGWRAWRNALQKQG